MRQVKISNIDVNVIKKWRWTKIKLAKSSWTSKFTLTWIDTNGEFDLKIFIRCDSGSKPDDSK